MQSAFLIRHGNSDYAYNPLTELGETQVANLRGKLEHLLPDHVKYSLVFSSSERTHNTAQRILPLIEKKAKNTLEIITDDSFGELNSMGSDEKVFAAGKRNVSLVAKYGENCDVLIIVSHEKILAATGIALAEEYGLSLPDNFGRIRGYTEADITGTMKEFGLSRKKVVETYSKTFHDELPWVMEASAIHCDFEKKCVQLIMPEGNSRGVI